MAIEELSIHQRGLRSRVRRLLEGRAEAADVAHIYAGLRSNAGDYESFREIGDFAAHPDLRNRGPSTNRLRDFMTVFEPLLARASGKELPIERVLDRALANLRMLEDGQIKTRFPFRTRGEIEKALKSAVFKMKNKLIGILTPAEKQLLIDFGDRAIWNPAFRDREVFGDFVAVLTSSGLVQAEEVPALESSKNLVIMYVLSAFHGVGCPSGVGGFVTSRPATTTGTAI